MELQQDFYFKTKDKNVNFFIFLLCKFYTFRCYESILWLQCFMMAMKTCPKVKKEF